MTKYRLNMILGVAAIVIAAHFFFKKTYLDVELVYELPYMSNGEMEYLFFHSKQSMDDSYTPNILTIPVPAGSSASYIFLNEMQDKYLLSNNYTFDFGQYSYCIVYGKKVSSMYYSYKTTYFDDRSSPIFSCRKRGKKCVFVTYDPNSVHGTYIYRVKKDVLLRGFYFNG